MRGEDFTITVQSMNSQIGTYATRHRLRVVRRIRGDVIAFQFSREP